MVPKTNQGPLNLNNMFLQVPPELKPENQRQKNIFHERSVMSPCQQRRLVTKNVQLQMMHSELQFDFVLPHEEGELKVMRNLTS